MFQGILETGKLEPTEDKYKISQELAQKTCLKTNKQTKTSAKAPWVDKAIMMGKWTQICFID